MAYPRQSPTVHVEELANEMCLYDWQRGQVHALNATAALVWQHCNGVTSPKAIADVLSRELAVPEAEAETVVRLTLRKLERAQLLVVPPDRPSGRPMPSRRALFQGVSVALLPAIYTIAAPSPLAAQSVVPPTITSLTPNSGTVGSAIDVTITGTGFGTTVAVSGTGVTVSNLREISSTTVIVTLTIAANATAGSRNVTVTTAGGTSNAVTFTVNATAPAAPTLTTISPAQSTLGTTVAVTLTGTNFIVGSTTVTVSGAGITVTGVTVASATSLTANFALDAAAALGARNVTVTTAGGTSGPVTFTVNLPAAPTLTAISPAQGPQGAALAVTLTGTNFVVGGTTLNVTGTGITVGTVTVISSTSLTAGLMLASTALVGGRSVTITTPGGTSGAVTFTITVAAGSATFNYTGSPQLFTVPMGVTSLTVVALGAQGGRGNVTGPDGGLGGSVTATLTVVSGEGLNIFVGNVGSPGVLTSGDGGFNGGRPGGAGSGGGGGGSSDIRRGGTAPANRVIVAGGGGGGTRLAAGGAGGGTTGGAGANSTAATGGGGGTPSAGGAGGVNSANSGMNGETAPLPPNGGQGGPFAQLAPAGGGGGGGGFFGGGGGAGDETSNLAGGSGSGGGGGSSFADPSATAVSHSQGVHGGPGQVVISW